MRPLPIQDSMQDNIKKKKKRTIVVTRKLKHMLINDDNIL